MSRVLAPVPEAASAIARAVGVRTPAGADGRAHFNPPVGSVLGGRYRIRREIAVGGGSRVVEGVDASTGVAYAVKLPRAGESEHSEEVQRLWREITALDCARHPGVVELVAHGTVERRPFLVLELLAGRSLSGLLASRGTLGLRETVLLGLELSQVLDVVHSRGIVHRDVKPCNVMVLPPSAVRPGTPCTRLLDFGVARLGADAQVTDRKLTQSGSILGTPEYMAPEALLAQPEADHRVDVYAVGATLYECLTGTVPFEGRYGEVLLKIATSEPPRIDERRRDLPPELARVVHRALAKDPSERYGSMRELARDLAAFVPITDSAPRPPPLPTAVRNSFVPTLPRGAVAQPPPLPPVLPATPQDDAASRRRFARAAYVVPALVSADGVVEQGRIEEVSEGGVLFVGSHTYASMSLAWVRFELPSGLPVEVQVQARWCRQARVEASTGFQFLNLPEAARAELSAYVGGAGGS
ncbi:MAG: protein kinase [Polyangiaceae bacterium]|nr:protein kinase [Polyangiaceae bacterium]